MAVVSGLRIDRRRDGPRARSSFCITGREGDARDRDSWGGVGRIFVEPFGRRRTSPMLSVLSLFVRGASRRLVSFFVGFGADVRADGCRDRRGTAGPGRQSPNEPRESSGGSPTDSIVRECVATAKIASEFGRRMEGRRAATADSPGPGGTPRERHPRRSVTAGRTVPDDDRRVRRETGGGRPVMSDNEARRPGGGDRLANEIEHAIAKGGV